MSDVALRFAASDDGLTAQFRRVNRQLEDFSSAAKRAGNDVRNSFRQVDSAIKAVGVGFVVRELLQFADGLEKASAQTGIGVEALQKLGFVALQTSGDLGSISAAVNRMQRSLVLAGEGSAEAAAALARLAIPINTFRSLAPDQQFEAVARSIAAIEDPAERTTAAIGLFGKAGAELLPVLVQAGQGLAEIDEKFAAIGGPVSALAIERVDDLGDTLGTTFLAAKSLGTELLAIAAPPVIAALEGLNTVVGALRFQLRGSVGDNQQVNISDEIDRLNGRIEYFRSVMEDDPNARTIVDQAIDRVKVLEAELQKLQDGPQIAEEAVSRGPRTRAKGLLRDLGDVKSAPDTKGAARAAKPLVRELTPEERRAKADVEAPAVLNFSTEIFKLEEVANQEHLDELIRQQGEYANQRINVESGLSQVLAETRRQFGIEEINFEELKAATIQDIGVSLAQSGIQIATALFGQNKKVALAVAAINIGVGATEALKLPFPANIAAVAKVIAQGAQLTAGIRNASIGGGGGFGGSAGGGGGESRTPGVDNRPVPTGASEQPAVQVYINGVVTNKVMDELWRGLEERFDRGGVLFNGKSRQAIELEPA